MNRLLRIFVVFSAFVAVFGMACPAFAGAQGKKVLMIVAKSDFEQNEYTDTFNALEGSGAVCTVASSKVGTLKGHKGKRVESTLLIKDANPADYDAIVIIGGNGIKKEWENEDAHNVVRQAAADGKIVAAICAAPGLLAYSGVLDGKKATAHPKSGARQVMGSHGCDYQSDSVVVDGNIITANGPKAASKFGEAIVSALSNS
ncbi:DJ-1/PfpI family protein [Maridesulfovibrio sp. FT414]|uniref:DJ-1/PfpI family protein n=1 Tax=Maridesulfovibrio sp. FT414 TaxID=2979469 RepID=UPI003D80767A